MEYLGYSIPLIIVALVGLANGTGFPRKYSTLLAIALGVLIEATYFYPHDIKTGIFMGVVIGLSASGLYSGTKSVCKNGDCGNGNGTSIRP